MLKKLCFILWSGLWAQIGFAEVSESDPAGFSVRSSAVVNANPAKVYEALTSEIAQWWDRDHTYSGDSANLSLDPKAGGCFCEKLENGGSIEHARIIYAAPGETLRMSGGLGPLQEMAVTGVMTWSLKPAEGGTELKMEYRVGGYYKPGLNTLAAIVDEVLAHQVQRLKMHLER